MVYNGDLIRIDNKKIDKIINYGLTYAKIWSSDSGRGMDGRNGGTLVGIFPKIVLNVGKMTEDEMSIFLSLVNKANGSVTYYDTEFKRAITESFYFGDITDSLNRKKDMSHKPIQFSIIANNPRSSV
ncbi:MAG: hypothetical protein RR406_05005 [Bacilli bacterium]